MSWLYVGDLRGSDLNEFRRMMGDQQYGEFVRGARALVGFQHHLGALEEAGDRTGLVDLLQRTQLQSGGVRVVVQSTETRSGQQYLNRSLARALQELGIEVIVAHEPQGGRVGTITFDTLGGVRTAGGRVETLAGSTTAHDQVMRLARLREVEETLTRYERFARPDYRQSQQVRAARERLERDLRDYFASTVENVQTGASGRARAALRDPTSQAAALQRLRQEQPIEGTFTPAYMDSVRELRRQGPHREIFETAVREARTTGRMSSAGIDALWEIEPQAAHRLVSQSGLSRGMQRSVRQQLPGAPVPIGSRAVAGFLLAIEVVNITAPLVQQQQVAAFNSDVRPFLEVIMWWQSKGVFPTMQGVCDNVWPQSNEWTTDPARIQALLNEDDLDYLAMTGVPDTAWDAFTVWATANLTNYNEFQTHILNSTAVRGSGPSIEEWTWSFKVGSVNGTTLGHEVNTRWVEDARLTTILRAAATAMIQGTEGAISDRDVRPGASFDQSQYTALDSIDAPLANLPVATGRYRFRQGIEEPTLYSLRRQRAIPGFSRDMLLYAFPSSVVTTRNLGEVPSGYIVVSGADYNSYMAVRSSPNHVRRVVGTSATGDVLYGDRTTDDNPLEVVLARQSDLEPAR